MDMSASKQCILHTTFRKQGVLNSTLRGLMGEANLCYARGQLETAKSICLEIIRQNPLSPEPFFTLAEIYESSNKTKYLNFLTIAAHLSPHSRDHWIRIAEMHLSEGNMQRAKICYTKAIKIFPKDYDIRLRKARLLEMIGEKNTAMLTYLKIIPYLPQDSTELCLNTAKTVARYFQASSKLHLALDAMNSAYKLCANLFSMSDINLYLELLTLNKSYHMVLKCLYERTDLRLEFDADSQKGVISCTIPEKYNANFCAKLCVSLIHLHANHLLGYLLESVCKCIPITGNYLNLYVDIAKALVQERKYSVAVELLRPIIISKFVECPAFIWLRYAECLRHLQRNNEAIDSLYRAVQLAPSCFEAKFTLSILLKQKGRIVEAVDVLKQDYEMKGKPANVRLLYERCLMLKQINKIDEYLEVGYALLSRQSVTLRSREEVLAASNGGSVYNADGVKVTLDMHNIKEATEMVHDYNSQKMENSVPSIQQEYNLFIDLVESAFALCQFYFIERLCFAMATTKRFINLGTNLEHVIILACYFNDECTIAFSYLRELISKNIDNISIWNFLTLLIQKGEDLRYHRYLRRLKARQPSTHQINLFIAHYHLHCCSYKYALNIYIPIFKDNPDALVALCIAVVFNQLSLQKKMLQKWAAVSQSIVFANRYAKLRKSPRTQQEILYNIGRIYHQAGLNHLALEYYDRGLAVDNEENLKHGNFLGLKQEIAYNVHLIYRTNGNFRKARQYLYEFIVM